MFFSRFTIVPVSALLCAVFLLGQSSAQAATARQPGIPNPEAVATDAQVNYCFARGRGLNPERLPPAYLVLRLRVTVEYHNLASRPLILPWEHERSIFTALKPGQLKLFKDGFGLFDGLPKAMDHLPPEVSPGNPIDPKNDDFVVIPASGTRPLVEQITLPVARKGVFKKYPDLRGHRLYVQLKFAHRDLTPILQAHLSDEWSRFGVPWTGTLATNTILVDVPPAPQAAPCQDDYTPAHPVVGADDKK